MYRNRMCSCAFLHVCLSACLSDVSPSHHTKTHTTRTHKHKHIFLVVLLPWRRTGSTRLCCQWVAGVVPSSRAVVVHFWVGLVVTRNLSTSSSLFHLLHLIARSLLLVSVWLNNCTRVNLLSWSPEWALPLCFSCIWCRIMYICVCWKNSVPLHLCAERPGVPATPRSYPLFLGVFSCFFFGCIFFLPSAIHILWISYDDFKKRHVCPLCKKIPNSFFLSSCSVVITLVWKRLYNDNYNTETSKAAWFSFWDELLVVQYSMLYFKSARTWWVHEEFLLCWMMLNRRHRYGKFPGTLNVRNECMNV